jgi:hypothetical protein
VAPGLSAITTCKGRLEHLKITLPALMADPGLEVVVVDYDCPDRASDWVRASWPGARLVAVEDRPVFSRSEAKNLGAAAASGEWLVFLDADVLIDQGFAARLEPLMKPGLFLLADPRPGDLWGAIVVRREDFERLGGFDEAMQGYGSEDVDLLERLMITGVREGRFPSLGMHVITHDEASRTRFHDLKDVQQSSTINGFYRTAKNDLLRQGVVLGLEARRKLYADVLGGFAAPEGLKTFQIGFRQTLIPGVTVNATLRYDLSPTAPADGKA